MSPQAAVSALACESAVQSACPFLAASGLCPAEVLRVQVELPLEAPEAEELKKGQQWGGTYSKMIAHEVPL